MNNLIRFKKYQKLWLDSKSSKVKLDSKSIKILVRLKKYEKFVRLKKYQKIRDNRRGTRPLSRSQLFGLSLS